ncbi:MAG: viroplasmin family protein [Microbacter sp.]
MGKAKQKFYAVWKGRKVGIFDSWDECKAQIDHFDGAQYKSFASKAEAEVALRQSYWNVIKTKTNSAKSAEQEISLSIISDSLAVDAACSGNPGKLEYRGVLVATRNEVFHQGPFEEGTNNIGEFLAIVDGLRYVMNQPSISVVYSDSAIAIQWVREKKCRTKLQRTERNDALFERIEAAEKWLSEHAVSIPVMKWETKQWGEIPADFGRK